MCFRPSSVDSSVMCPSCGKKVSALGGVALPNCPFCNADLSNARLATADDNLETSPLGNAPMAAPAAPSAPGVVSPVSGAVPSPPTPK